MGKKDQETRDKSWMTLHESIRRNSHRLEKHILARNSEKVKLIIDLNLRKQRISAATYNRCNDILLGLKLGRKSTERKDSQNEQRKMDQIPGKTTEAVGQHGNQQRKDHEIEVLKEDENESEEMPSKAKCNLPSEFQELMQRSIKSYEQTSAIFRKGSLKERYQHLFAQKEEKQDSSHPTAASVCEDELSRDEQDALHKIKKLYHKYRVCHIFRVNLQSKVKRNYIDQLIRKGCLRENQPDFISLAC